MIREPLPIDVHLLSIVSSLKAHSGLVIIAPPGAGKTTRIPRALYDAGFAGDGEILILQPRRLATRLAAARVAAELGESLGQTVGFAIRFQSVGGRGTRIRFVTEGILSRRIVQDPLLRDVSVVLLDEFHERHVATDIGLALLRRLQLRERPDLKVLVLSATMDPAPVAAFIGNVPIVTCQESRYPSTIEFAERADERPLHEKVLSAVSRILRDKVEGDILVFLPGAAEIRMAADALDMRATCDNLAILPLHGDLPQAQQSIAIEPNPRRKIILATNVAETSVTVPGIAAVVDSGLARVAVHSPWTGIPALRLARISKAAAVQRAGRAGRTQPGRVIRLYTRQDFETRPQREVPEIRRADLAETLLALHGAGLPQPRDLQWFEAPPPAALDAAESLLRSLAALDREGGLTATGRSMMRFPVHPRLARLIIEGEKLHVAHEACCLAALLSERDIRLEVRVSTASASSGSRTGRLSRSDALELLGRYEEAKEAGFDARRLRSLGLDQSAVERVRRAQEQLERLAAASGQGSSNRESGAESIQIALLAAFPDRVAKRRGRGRRDLVLSVGGEARLSETSSVHEAPLLIALDVEERRSDAGNRAANAPLIRLASAVEPEWLAALFPYRLREETDLVWNERAGRIDEARRTFYDQLSLEEVVRPAAPSPEASALLADAVVSREFSCFRDYGSLAEVRVRLGLLADHFPEEKIPRLDQPSLQAVIRKMCDHRCSLAELARLSLVEHCLAGLTSRQKDLLQRQVPDRISLGARRNIRIHYEEGKPPWIESRIQDFFNVKTSPTICGGKTRLTVRLLAPSGRPVQITQDLAGFWRRHYPAIRRELQRRYPKHPWPAPGDS